MPLVLNLEEAIAQGELLFNATPAVANPILDFRRIESQDDGKSIYFKRHGSLADEHNNTLADWDAMGVYYFNAEGKIYAIRDYLDNYRPFAFLREVGFPEGQLKAFYDTGMDSHTLNKNQKADPF